MRSQCSSAVSGKNDLMVDGNWHSTREASLCKFFLKGTCNRGPHCSFSHSSTAKRPECRFFFSLQVSVVFWLIQVFANNNVFL